MTKESQESGADAVAKAQAFIVQQIKSGADKDRITAGFKEMGVAGDEAGRIVDSLYPEIMRAAKQEQFTTEALPLAVIGGVLAAVVGGAVWGGIVIFTGYEVGFVAWGLGFLSGAAVVYSARGKKGLPLQVVAVVSSVAGIAVGKYLSYYHFLKQAVLEEYGPDAAANLSILSREVFDIFTENAASILGGYDILWVVLAVITAWRIPQGMGIKAPAHLQV